MNKNKLLLVVMLLSLIGGFFVGYIVGYIHSYEVNNDKYNWNSKNPDISHYWTCMDGCFEMQMIIEEELEIKRSEDRHTKCSDNCWEMLIELEGDYTEYETYR